MSMYTLAQAEECDARTGAGWAGAESPLAFQQPVPRRLVHRSSMAEVFVTGAVPTGDGRFLVGAQWPRDHALYHPDQRRFSDPLLFAETIRQALVYLAHEYYGVPLSYRFIGGDVDFDIARPELLRVGGTPVSVVLDATWTWRRRLPRRYDMRLEVVLTVNGERCGTGNLDVLAVDERRYALLRQGRTSRALPAAFDGAGVPRPGGNRIDPAAVGRLRAKDVVLEPGASDGAWRMSFDLDHAILFDHPTDHIPLMVVLEGFRQVGHLEVHGLSGGVPDGRPHVLLGASVECRSFGELDEPVELIVRDRARGPVPGSDCLAVEAVQAGRPFAGALLTWGFSERADTAAA